MSVNVLSNGILARLKKTTAIKRIAVQEIRVFRHHGVPINGPVLHTMIVLRGLMGPFMVPSLSRETPVSRTAMPMHLIAVVFLV